MRRGVRLGIDVGSVRVGVAASDPEGILAYPVATLARTSQDGNPPPFRREDTPLDERGSECPLDERGAGPHDERGAGPHGIPAGGEPAEPADEVGQIADLVREHAAIEVVVGLPRSLDGGEGPAAALARRYAQSVALAIAPVPVRLVDERMTTVDAHRNLRASGVAGRSQRRVVDQAAAVLILQTALEQERATGNPPGTPAIGARRKPRRKGTT